MDTANVVIDPIFARDGERWQPGAEAGGPFGGLHGGAVSGLIVAEMEREARERHCGLALGASVLLLRPAPMAPLTTRTDVLRQGDRAAVIETTLLAEEKLIAKGTASFVTAVPAEATPAAAGRIQDPSALPAWRSVRRFSHRTFFDALDLRDDGAGVIWGRLLQPITAAASPLAAVFAVADNATAFFLTKAGIEPRWGFPNIDIAIHVSRAPIGAWIGVEAHSDWRPEGRGITEARLYDAKGPLGRACQTVVLIPAT